MSKQKREHARGLSQAFRRMNKPASKGGTGGTFTAAATKAGHADTPKGREEFANQVLSNPDEYSEKMVKKANFYRNVISKQLRQTDPQSRDEVVAFSYSGKDVATALSQGVDNKQSRAETPVTFAYEAGTPIRFAGSEISKRLGGTDGEFGFMSNNRKDKEAQGYLKRFADQWTSGPFGPDMGDQGGVA